MVDPSSPEVRVNKCLSRKAYPREKIIRTDHHQTHLEEHQKRGLVPKRIRLERKYNPVLVDSQPRNTRKKIESVLSKADWEIHKIMVNHYRELIITINNKLEAVEDSLIKLEKATLPQLSIKTSLNSTN